MIYAIVHLTITNPDSLAAYRDHAADALARHGGKVESAAKALTVLEGTPATPDLCAVLSFPDKAAAMAWIEDPDLAEVHALRRGAGRSDILLVG